MKEEKTIDEKLEEMKIRKDDFRIENIIEKDSQLSDEEIDALFAGLLANNNKEVREYIVREYVGKLNDDYRRFVKEAKEKNYNILKQDYDILKQDDNILTRTTYKVN